MHEMSIAVNIIKISKEELEKAKGENIEKIHIEIGLLSGIVPESLRFALEVSKKEGVLRNADIVISEVPGKLHCLNCNREFESNDFFTCCPDCQMHKFDVLAGKELIIKSITII